MFSSFRFYLLNFLVFLSIFFICVDVLLFWSHSIIVTYKNFLINVMFFNTKNQWRLNEIHTTEKKNGRKSSENCVLQWLFIKIKDTPWRIFVPHRWIISTVFIDTEYLLHCLLLVCLVDEYFFSVFSLYWNVVMLNSGVNEGLEKYLQTFLESKKICLLLFL